LEHGYHVRDNYFNSSAIVNDTKGYDYILGGLISQTSQSYDGEISEELTNYLFRRITENFGSDLAARNIQRGRDHGAPAYNVFRKHCGLPELTNWDGLHANISDEAWQKLREAYVNVTDIDIYSGGLMEERVQGGQCGPTFACLMGIQFQRLKYGDRFFFTHSDQTGSFTQVQLQALRKRTLGDIICENSNLEGTSPNVFKTDPANTNTVKCSEASRKLDISLFSDNSDNGESGASGLQLLNMAYIIIVLFVNYNLQL